MVAYGADVGELRSLATLFRAKADLLDDDVVVIGAGLRRSPWSGVDADGFRHLWSSQTSQRLRLVASSLRAAAETLDRNATEQDHASRAEGGTSAVPRAEGSPRSGTPPRGGSYGHARDSLDLAAACGDHTVGKEHDAKIPAGWSEVSSNELEKLGIDPELLRSKGGDGFSATLYKSADGRYVLAYAGTELDDPGDLLTHVMSYPLRGVPRQVGRAIEASTLLKTQLEAAGVSAQQISFTGHSLGGELAAASSIATGLKATTFNAAGLNELSIARAAHERLKSGGRIFPPLEAISNVTSYVGTADPLTKAQKQPVLAAFGLSMRPAFGVSKVMETPPARNFEGHELPPLATAIDEMAAKEGHGYYAPAHGGAASPDASVRP